MKWMPFLTPVAGMDAEEARAYMKEHKEGTYAVLHDITEKEKGHLAALGNLIETRI